MLKIQISAILVILLSLMSCKNIVTRYDTFVHKSYVRKDFSSESIALGNHEVFYYDNKRKDAPVVLFVHGFGGDGKLSWIEQAKTFSKDYRVIIPDILWFGRSKSKDAPELQTQINAMAALIKSLEIERLHLVGISYGGFISLGLAQELNEKLASLTIVDSPGVHFSDEEQKAFIDKIGVDHIADAFIPKNSEEVERMFSFAFRKPPKLPKFIRTQTLGVYLSQNPEEQRSLLLNLPQNRKAFEHLNIKTPTLILWGEDDEIFLVKDAKELQKQLNAELIVIPKAGHGLPSEKPKAFNEALNSFIQRIEMESNAIKK
ncbi:alpha/beta fold hydrolase [Brumimicrobium oceani]|uniref:AB hydrolase-1 domain-containing protein n=1 Tax=Brumimicrobium oceani TaxID=2100725 RepID=A0A2U2XBW6_9FLAO|nr:alpha/beta hydrolase [Brumimicrobium oceani]PWH85294.1 hypothetical protein DIT68_10170 [Brumimicrobium oceani]